MSARFHSIFTVVIVLLVFCLIPIAIAQTDVEIQIMNLPEEFNDETLSLAGTINDWNNASSLATVENNILTYSFTDIDITPLDIGWQDTPEGANAAFSFFDPGTWNQRIVGNYGSNDNNFRVALPPDNTNLVTIDASYSLTEPPWLTIDVTEPSVLVNGVAQFPPPELTNILVSVENMPIELEGVEISILGSVLQPEETLTTTVINGTFTFDITIREKGEVATVFSVKRDGEVEDHNHLKDFIKAYKFHFKMPKSKSYKFQYKFQFK